MGNRVSTQPCQNIHQLNLEPSKAGRACDDCAKPELEEHPSLARDTMGAFVFRHNAILPTSSLDAVLGDDTGGLCVLRGESQTQPDMELARGLIGVYARW
jgi:hypothetical protein